jgi:hypothetical protein
MSTRRKYGILIKRLRPLNLQRRDSIQNPGTFKRRDLLITCKSGTPMGSGGRSSNTLVSTSSISSLVKL